MELFVAQRFAEILRAKSNFAKTLRNARGMDTIYLVLLLVFIADFLKTFFSFSIYNRPISATCALGYCLAMMAFSHDGVNS